MENIKKNEMQNEIIKSLRKENKELKNKIQELENIIVSNKEVIDASNKLIEEYKQCMYDFNTARDRYKNMLDTLIKESTQAKRDFKKIIAEIK